MPTGRSNLIPPVGEAVPEEEVGPVGEAVPVGEAGQEGEAVPAEEAGQEDEGVSVGELVAVGVGAVTDGEGRELVGEGVGGMAVGEGVGRGVAVGGAPWVDGGDVCVTIAATSLAARFPRWSTDCNLTTADLCAY